MEAKNWQPIIAMILIVVAILIVVLIIIQGFWAPAIEAGQGSMQPSWY